MRITRYLSLRFARKNLCSLAYDANRGGLLGMSAVLTVSANSIETSPVVRGFFILENILGTLPPPDDVPVIEPDVRGAKSVRELTITRGKNLGAARKNVSRTLFVPQALSTHRESTKYHRCQRKIDPLAFALEIFALVGVRWPCIGKAKIDSAFNCSLHRFRQYENQISVARPCCDYLLHSSIGLFKTQLHYHLYR